MNSNGKVKKLIKKEKCEKESNINPENGKIKTNKEKLFVLI